MSMSYTKALLVLLLILAFKVSNAQNDFESLGESSFSVNSKVANNYSIHFALKSRNYFYKDDVFEYEQRQIDIVHFSTLKLDYNHSISLGVQYRNRSLFEDKENELRLTQQFNYTKQGIGLRFGHRVRSEQRIIDDLTIYRQRYRFSTDLPLNGEKLDVGEPYFIASMELLWSLSRSNSPEIDHRTTAQIGFKLTEKLKIQIGTEYRFEAFNIKSEQKLFLLTSASLKI